MSNRASGSELGLCTKPITFVVRLEPPFTRRTRIRFPWIMYLASRGPDCRESVRMLSSSACSRLRGHPYGRGDGQYQRPAIRHGTRSAHPANGEQSRCNPIEPQARHRQSAPFGNPPLCYPDLDGNSLPGDREIAVGRSFALFPGRRELPGHSLKSGPLALPQSAHASLPMQNAAEGRRLCLRVTDFTPAASHDAPQALFDLF